MGREEARHKPLLRGMEVDTRYRIREVAVLLPKLVYQFIIHTLASYQQQRSKVTSRQLLVLRSTEYRDFMLDENLLQIGILRGQLRNANGFKSLNDHLEVLRLLRYQFCPSVKHQSALRKRTGSSRGLSLDASENQPETTTNFQALLPGLVVAGCVKHAPYGRPQPVFFSAR